MANLMMWKVHAVFDVLGVAMQCIAAGPSEVMFCAQLP